MVIIFTLVEDYSAYRKSLFNYIVPALYIFQQLRSLFYDRFSVLLEIGG